jgi:hypothetical protein
MAEKIEVEVTGRSKYGIAHMMAVNILTVIKKKKFSELTPEGISNGCHSVDALHTVVQ